MIRSLVGHSDADVGLHALTDALLGAIGAGDIGMHFPPTEPRWRGAASDRFLAHAAALVREKGGDIAARRRHGDLRAPENRAASRAHDRTRRRHSRDFAGAGQRQGDDDRSASASPAAAKGSPRRPSRPCGCRCNETAVPAKAGIHLGNISLVEKWVPAFAGIADPVCVKPFTASVYRSGTRRR